MADETPPDKTGTGTSEAADTGNPPEGLSLDGDDQAPAGGAPNPDDPKANKKSAKKGGLKALLSRFSVYLLMFVLVIVLAIMVVVISYMRSHTKAQGPASSQTLSQSSLSQLSTSDVSVGDVKQTLSVQSNAVFAGQVLVQKDLQIAGKLQVGGTLSLTGISVSGDSVFDTIQINKNLTVAGDTALQGQLTVQKSVNVNGSGTFNGPISAPQVTTNNLQLNSDLTLTHHITAGGVNPGRSNGSALGGGGTASISGSDTAGSITINTGNGPVAGCLISVTFATKYNSTPHVIISPVDAAAANLGYYVTRNTSGFNVCVANAPAPGQSFGFDYMVLD